MSASIHQLKIYQTRAPRYVLDARDNAQLRFARVHDHNQSFITEIHNISETGMAFTMDRSYNPQIDDLIKLEFQVPGMHQIAWFGRIIRIEAVWDKYAWDLPPRHYSVGIRFENLPGGHLNLLRQGLREQFERIRLEHKLRAFQNLKYWLRHHGGRYLRYMFATLLAFAVLYLI